MKRIALFSLLLLSSGLAFCSDNNNTQEASLLKPVMWGTGTGLVTFLLIDNLLPKCYNPEPGAISTWSSKEEFHENIVRPAAYILGPLAGGIAFVVTVAKSE